MASNEQFYNRMREIAGIKPVNESKTETNTRTLVDIERANNGTVYGIVKENHQYFIKKALKEGEVKVTDFVYIDGIENKRKYQYDSLSEAEKQRNFYVRGINEAFDQGGVYFVNESKNTETPSLDVNEDFSSLVRRTINEGKKNLSENREKKFKSSLPAVGNAKDTTKVRRGLMPEAADYAVKKALGLINENAMVTADSEIKSSDIVADKKGKESPQAPINDSNAKAKAEKATGTSKKDANKKPNASDSLAVNQENDVLKEEASPLVTDDSEIITNDSLANKVSQKHESPQAPINDGNAKAEADKATGSGSSTEAISNNVDDSPESDPFDDKENAGDETGDIVTENTEKGNPFDKTAKTAGGDEVTADSDQTDADRVANSKKVTTKAESSHTDKNQPEKGQKEEKGEKLKPVASKKDIVAEGEDLITADSEIEAADALANLTKTNLPNPVAENEDFDNDDDDDSAKKIADAESDPKAKKAAMKDMKEGKDSKEKPESNPFAKKEKAGDEKGDIVAEGGIITADSEIDPKSLDKDNVTFNKPANKKGVSDKMNDNAIAEADAKEKKESNPFAKKEKAGDEKGDIVAENLEEAGEEELDAAANALGNLDAATDAEEATPEMGGGEELPVDAELPVDGGEELPVDGGEELPVDGGEEVAVDAEAGAEGTDDLIVKEIEKLVGKTTEKIRSAQLEPEKAEGFLKSIVSAFDDKLPEMDVDDRKEVADKILKADDSDIEGGAEEMPVDGGEEVAVDAEVGGGDFGATEEPSMEEDAPMTVNGEDVIDGEIPDGNGGTFEEYMESRGYSADNLAECSVSEMGSIVSGYISDKDELDEAEIESIAGYMNGDVAAELEEYGHGDFAKKAAPFMKEDGVSFGSVEPTLSGIEMEEDDMEDEMDAELSDDGGEEMEAEFGDNGGEEVSVVSVGEPAEEEEVEVAPQMGFANAAEVMGGGVVKPDGAKTKSVEVNLNAGTVKLEVSEGNVKVREYIKNRIQELAGKRKPSINESSKSENLKKLDKLIEQQWKLVGDKMLKN